MTSSAVFGWSFDGHRSISEAAIEILGPGVPLNREIIEVMVEGSVFPDFSRPRSLPQLYDRENPQHFIDLEPFGGQPLPPTRTDYIRSVVTLAASPNRPWEGDWNLGEVGVLPYTVVEATQQLATVLAQLRRDPDSARLQWAALHYAGVLAHFSEDLCQPLHTTIHHDGRALVGGKSSSTGLHLEVDTLLEVVAVDSHKTVKGLTASVFDDLFGAVTRELDSSHDLVDRVYELEPEIRAASTVKVSAEVERFAVERFRSAAWFTASLIETAWRLSAEVELPTD